jgi:NAD+ kinase
MKGIGLFVNPQINKFGDIFQTLRKFSEQGISFFSLNDEIKTPDFVKKNINEELSAILVFGGDGTILRAVPISLKYNAPILGINFGRLGFLTESDFKELNAVFTNILKEKYKIQNRMLLTVTVNRNKQTVYKELGLNDAVVIRGNVPKLINIKIKNNKRFVLETRCDGVIASTPTGSTAYSLSAGGPILTPTMDAIVFTPINPHILSVRPMVFKSSDKLHFIIEGLDDRPILQIDGKNNFNLKSNDEVLITASKKKVSFIKLTNKTFYQILRRKMHMGKI